MPNDWPEDTGRSLPVGEQSARALDPLAPGRFLLHSAWSSLLSHGGSGAGSYYQVSFALHPAPGRD